MRLKYKLLLGFGILILLFMIFISYNLFFLNQSAKEINRIVENNFTTEKYIQDSYLIIMRIHAEIWDTMLFDIKSRQKEVVYLDNLAISFYKNIDDLSEKIPYEASSLRELRNNFRLYYQFGSSILQLKDLQDFQSKKDIVNRFKENKNLLNSLLDKTLSASKKDFESSLIKLNMGFAYSRITMAVFTVVLILLAFFISFFLADIFTKPIISIVEGTKQIIQGNFDKLVEVSSEDEIGTLALEFNTMILELKKTLEELNTEIFERKVAEEELRKTRNYLKNIFDSLSSVLISINKEGIITQWNTAAERETGIPASKAVSKRIWEMIPILKQYEGNFEEVIKKRMPLEIRRESLSEEEKRYFNISFYPLVFNGTGGVVIRLDDITELEQKDSQLRQAQKMETVGRLAGGLAHDFNNVLVGIVGSVSLIKFMLDNSQKISKKNLKENISIIENSAKRASDMVNQLLALSRKQELTLTTVDLNIVIKNVLQICRNTLDKSIEINVNLKYDNALVRADFTQMEQVLLNLCVNAAHAMTIMKKPDEHQGGKLTISLDNITTDSNFLLLHPESKDERYWVIVVKDTGVGIDKKIMSKIFDPFFTTKEKDKGTGLGLTMVYNIVHQHNGIIEVNTKINEGSEFKVYLPALETMNKSQESGYEEIAKGNETILLVDDEENVRKVGKAILEQCGYHVILAENGQESIEIFKKKNKKIDLVMLDLTMPKISGRETFLEMKMIKPDVKVLIASGFKNDIRVKDTIESGAKDVIQKPFSLMELAFKVRKVLDNK